MELLKTSLDEYVAAEILKHDNLDNAFGDLISRLAKSCTVISNLIRKGSISGSFGDIVDINIQGEHQKKLDILTNEIILDYCSKVDGLCAIASEEMELPSCVETLGNKYLVLVDPLDGSSNIEVNGPVGTIISILPAPKNEDIAIVEKFLQPGTNQLGAIYVLYGPSTIMVITLGDGVYEFINTPGTDKFILSRKNIKIPNDTSEFGINASNQRFWEEPVKRYISECLCGTEGNRKKNFNMRWVAAMVCDVHRIICRGGTFMYPIDEKTRNKGGRLRLMYEANPMSFIVEQAGGESSTGYHRILTVNPRELHQRVPVILGSKNEVQRLIRYHADYQVSKNK